MFVTRLLSGVVLVIIAFISFFIGAPVLPLFCSAFPLWATGN